MIATAPPVCMDADHNPPDSILAVPGLHKWSCMNCGRTRYFNTESIDCPAHPGEHQAVLFCNGGEFEGIWECNATGEGISDEHDHYGENTEIEVETFTHDTFEPVYGHDQYQTRSYVCGGTEGCGVVLDGDPDEDAAQDRADAEYDEMRDNQND